MPARFDIEGPTNAQWLEAESGGTPAAQTGSPSSLFRAIQEAILRWMQGRGVDQRYAYPPSAGRTGFVIHPSSAQARATGAHPFAVDGILGVDSLTMIRAIAIAQNATAVATAANSDLQNHRISPATLGWGISLARAGKSITIPSTATMPRFGMLPTGAPRGGVVQAGTSATTASPFAPPGTSPAPPPASTTQATPDGLRPNPYTQSTPGATPDGTPTTTVLASFTEPTPAPASWTSSVPKWAWWAGGSVALVGTGLVIALALRKPEPDRHRGM